MAPAWYLRTSKLTLDRPRILGIVNVTPDSFSDGGRFFSGEAAVEHGLRLVEDGADVLDIGGESTRPQGATPVDAGEELARVLPVVRGLHERVPEVPLSVDTVKSEVAAAVLDEGAEIINDVSAFRLDPAGAEVCARAGAGVILMHSRGTVADMATYQNASYREDVAGEVLAELGESIRLAAGAGVERERIALDPGVGFSKRSEHSLAVLAAIPRFVVLGYPVVVGVSRKRFIGELTGVSNPAERVEGTVGANVMALALGARIFRVHDVRAARRALDVGWAILQSGGEE
ncbi:MAG TPA: dihydropteroate synthase [Gemmatimonadaceae bacterium]|nr:dihydropteroate synthase [Gemmatimonadaceae bacterium]